jgi:hypothetical protein
LLGEHELTSAALFDFELAIGLADDPPVVELAAWAYVMEKGEEVPAGLVNARPVVAQTVYAGILKRIGHLKAVNLGLRVFLTRQVVFFHYTNSPIN